MNKNHVLLKWWYQLIFQCINILSQTWYTRTCFTKKKGFLYIGIQPRHAIYSTQRKTFIQVFMIVFCNESNRFQNLWIILMDGMIVWKAVQRKTQIYLYMILQELRSRFVVFSIFMSWKLAILGLVMMHKRRGQSDLMRPQLISIQILKAGNIQRLGKQYTTGIRVSGRRSYSWGTSNNK